MKKKYQESKRVQRSKLQELRREFEALDMKEDETVTEYFTRIKLVANNMHNNGETKRHQDCLKDTTNFY